MSVCVSACDVQVRCRAVPEACPGLTAEKLREDGVFLWTNGSEAILFFGQRVPPQLIHATIGESAAGHAVLTPCAAYQACSHESLDKTSSLWILQTCLLFPQAAELVEQH